MKMISYKYLLPTIAGLTLFIVGHSSGYSQGKKDAETAFSKRESTRPKVTSVKSSTTMKPQSAAKPVPKATPPRAVMRERIDPATGKKISIVERKGVPYNSKILETDSMTTPVMNRVGGLDVPPNRMRVTTEQGPPHVQVPRLAPVADDEPEPGKEKDCGCNKKKKSETT